MTHSIDELVSSDLDWTALHASISGPASDSMNLLNEIMDRFPNAISFAPGAPFMGFMEPLAIPAYIDRYRAYLRDIKHMPERAIDRHICQYGPSQGLINGLVAEALQRDFGIDVSDEAVVITVGCQEAMLLAVRALCATDQDVLGVVQPCYVGMIGAARLLDVAVEPVDECGGSIDLEQLRSLCHALRSAGKRLRALYVAPDFANPSGTILDIATRHQLLRLAQEQDFLILEDSAYAFTTSAQELVPPIKALDTHRRVIYLGTFSKLCMPGARVGYIVADQQVRTHRGTSCSLAKTLATIKSMISVNTAPICQAIVGGILLHHGGSLVALGQRKAEFYRASLARLLEALHRHVKTDSESATRVSWNTPGGGFFVRMVLPVASGSQLLEYCARRYGVLWTPMTYFYLNKSQCNEIRLSCSYLTPDLMEDGVRRLARFLMDPRVSCRAAS
jgi:(S)-3,5-dihydroxyphenylglycine transaminase